MTYHGMQPDVFDATDLDILLELREQWTELRKEDLELQTRLGAPRIMVMR